MYFFGKPQNIFDYFCFHQDLDENQISSILQVATKYNFYEAILGDENNPHKDDSYRRSQIKWIEYEESTQNLYTNLIEIIKTANNAHFNFDIFTSDSPIQYTEYLSSVKGAYNWHQDTPMPYGEPPLRKLSLVIQLSDPSEYEGGDLEIYMPHPEDNEIFKTPKKKGKIIVFPSYMWHRVTPVTKGVRKSLVWWVGGSPFR